MGMGSSLQRKYEKTFRILIWVALLILVITLMVFSFIRSSELYASLRSGTFPEAGSIEAGYARQPLLTYLHILPGMLFIILGAMQFLRPLRSRYPKLHRRTGRIYLVLGMIIGVTAIIMAFVVRFGGWVETAAVLLFGSYFLFSLIKAFRHVRRRQFDRHREWMIRAYSIGLAVATMRPVIGLMIAFANVPFPLFFGYAFWLAFILHFLVAEWWIRYTRMQRRVDTVQAIPASFR